MAFNNNRYVIVSSGFNDNEEYAETFYIKYQMKNYSNFRKMIMCSYFSMTILSTVGYGDMVPQTNTERIFTTIIMILGIAFFSYIMGMKIMK